MTRQQALIRGRAAGCAQRLDAVWLRRYDIELELSDQPATLLELSKRFGVCVGTISLDMHYLMRVGAAVQVLRGPKEAHYMAIAPGRKS